LIFRVPFRGSFLLLLFSASIFLMTSLERAISLHHFHTQQQANMMSFFFSSRRSC